MSDEVCMVDEDWTRTRRSIPWYEDGNIVLIAADCSALYRVHRGILCSYSSIFQDMFTASQAGPEDIEGCSVVRLTDSAEDLEHVLKALYDRSYCSSGAKFLPIAAVTAFLRLGKKYDIPHLFKEAKSRLLVDFPPTLEQWEEVLDAEWQVASPIDMEMGKDIIISVINLAREVNLLVILPAAYYMCLRAFSLREILTGIRDGSGKLQTLTPEARQVCALAVEPFWRLTGETFSFLRATCDSSSCTKYRKHFIAENFFPWPNLEPISSIPEEFELAACLTCRSQASASHEAGRKAIWDRLPGIFGLPSWAELTKDD